MVKNAGDRVGGRCSSYCNPKGPCISTLRRPSNAWVSLMIDHSERNFSTACFGNMNFKPQPYHHTNGSLQLLHCTKGVYYSSFVLPSEVSESQQLMGRIFVRPTQCLGGSRSLVHPQTPPTLQVMLDCCPIRLTKASRKKEKQNYTAET